MERVDWWVVIVCASLGYFIVSWLIDKYREKTSSSVESNKSDHDTHSNEGGQRNANNGYAKKDYETKHWYEVLEVPASASLEEVQKAYRRKIQQYHPDRLEGMAPELHEHALRKSQLINAAYTEAIRIKSRHH